MTKSLFQCFCWLVLLIFLSSCGTISIQPMASQTATPVDEAAISTAAVATVFHQITETAMNVTMTPEPPTPTGPKPTWTPLPFFTLDGLRVAYVIKGNLYVQESGGQPLQLTQSGEDGYPQFSDDGQRLIIYRGPSVYLVNIDGSGEQELATGKQLARLGHGYDQVAGVGEMVFVPGTHQLLFQTNTKTNQPQTATPPPIDLNVDNVEINQQPTGDLLLMDVDSGKIKLLFPPGAQVGYFQASPDGKMAWVWVNDHIDVISLDGKSKQRLADYPSASERYYMEPGLFWTQDSRKLSLFLPAEESGLNGGPKLRTIWQFSLDGGSPVEIHFSPPPELINYSSISPDGNWVVYTYNGTEMLKFDFPTSGVYLGNLRDGTTQFTGFLGTGASAYYWSPDSEHFTFDSDGMFLGNTRGEITQIGDGGFLGWVDDRRYLSGGKAMGEIGKEGKVRVVNLPAGYLENFTFVFIKPK
jgi:hypothetical protein